MRTWMRRARLKLKLTQSDMAKKLGITEEYYSYIENGKRMPKLDLEFAAQIAGYLKIPLERIVQYEAERKNDCLRKTKV